MKQLSALLSLLLIALSANSQNMDLQSMSALRQHNLAKTAAAGQDTLSAKKLKKNTHGEYTVALIRLNDGFDADDLRAQGVDVQSMFANIALANVRMDDVESISALPCVKVLTLQRTLSTNMDLARAEQGVDLIHHGSAEAGLSVPYTGKGVVTGIIDQGIDPHHINFRYADGTSRIEALWSWKMNSMGMPTSDYYNYTTIGDFETDNRGTYHGTHTMGIMAGSYDGPVQVAEKRTSESTPVSYITENCKYYGVAPQASLAVSCGELQDGFIAYGMENILNFAEWLRQEDKRYQWPLVWNMSLGSNQGPHDPRTNMNIVLNELGKRGIACVSAGNEGDLKIALKKTFTESEKTVKTFLYPYAYRYDESDPESFTARTGSVAIYSDDETPFTLKAVIYRKSRGYKPAKNMGVVGDGVGTYYCSSADYQMDASDIVGDATFVKAFEGYVGVGGKIDEQTGRYYGMVDFYVINAKSNLNDELVLGFEVEGVPGHSIECYGDAQNTWMDNCGVEGFTDGSTDGTISDMAIAENIIAVGSYNTRNEWVCLDGFASRYEGDGFMVGGISGFSSYGTAYDGRDLPVVCAPGAAIISSVSYPFIKTALDAYGQDYVNLMCQAKMEEPKRVNYWKQEVGTSMSTPFVAGSIALWLEADPTLNVAEVKDIIQRTAVRDRQVEATREQKRWGAGKFSAIGGLKEVIRHAGVQGVDADGHNDRLILTREGDRSYKVFVGNAARIDAAVYTADGRLVKQTSSQGDEAVIDMSDVASGLYIINVNGRHSAKIAVK